MLEHLEVLSRRGIPGFDAVAAADIDGLPLMDPTLEGDLFVLSLSATIAVRVTGFGVGSLENRGMPVPFTGLLVGGSMLIVGWC